MKKAILLLTFLGTITATSNAQDKVISGAGAAQNKGELVNRIVENRLWVNGQLVERHITLQLPEKCWERILNDDGEDHFSRWGYAITEYAKKMDYGDLEALGGMGVNSVDEKDNRPRMNKIMDGFKDKFSFTIKAEGVICDNLGWRLLKGYSSTVRDFVEGNSTYRDASWKPKGGTMHITLILSDKAKDISVALSPDGTKFTVTGPSEIEVSEWSTKIEKGLARGGK
ncbi:MAG: hypothetical protein ACK4GN_06115 [Runella sp.]